MSSEIRGTLSPRSQRPAGAGRGRLRTAGMLALLLASWCVGMFAQQRPCSIETVLVSVTDQKWNSIDGLTANDFRAHYRRKPVEVLSARRDNRGRRVVLLIDTSGSMADFAMAEQMIATDILRSAPLNVSFALKLFGDNIEDSVAFGKSIGALGRRVDALTSKAWTTHEDGIKTALWDAIEAGLRELGRPDPGDAICVLTDAGDNQSKTRPSQVQRDLLTSRVRLFAWLFAPRRPTRLQVPEQMEAITTLTGLVSATGGMTQVFSTPRVYNPSGQEDVQGIPTAARQICMEISEPYALQIRVPETLDKPREWQLDVTNANGKKNSNLYVFHPMLVPCSLGP